MARSPITPDEAAEQETLGARIREFRERRGLQKQELATALGVDPSAITHIEAGRRSVNTSRLNTIAKILGVSVLALLDDDSPLGELAVAARTGSPSDLNADDEPMVERVRALAELSHVLDEGGVRALAAPAAPAVSIRRWQQDSTALASWTLGQLSRRYLNEEPGVLDDIEDVLGVDVLCVPFAHGPLGMSAHLGNIRIIVLNSCQDRRISRFTLSHELGHVLGQAHSPLCVTKGFVNTDPHERFANAFAAQLLAPDDNVRARFPDQDAITPDNLIRAWLDYGMNWKALVYRLHNAGVTNAAGRNELLKRSVSGWATACTDKRLCDLVQRENRGPSGAHRAPRLLTQRCAQGYLQGVLSIRPYAGLTRIDEYEATEELDAVSAVDC
ncbi:MAG: hypothetical protein QG671_2077 [Actinomycetota bacterium]|nr:hypothetical protein [Actinomycetota bacterium]